MQLGMKESNYFYESLFKNVNFNNKNELCDAWREERALVPQHNFEGKCLLFRDALLHTSSDPPVGWCTRCLPSEMVTP